jgi:hypothetical protein
MFNLLSLLIGGITFLLALVAFVPLLGWANWLLIPVAAVGLVLGVLSRSTTGRNLNLVVLGICTVRLMIGNGIF